MAKNRCIKCKTDSGNNRICKTCYQAAFAPCTDCGKPTPTITTLGKQVKNTTCVACTARAKADTRRIGVTCKVCKNRTHDFDQFYQMCATCMIITTPCPVCNQPMPMYRKRGMLRKFCSHRCSKIAHPTTRKQAKKAQKTKWANHIYKSHQNKIARNKSEYTDWRNGVFARDNYTCQKCGKRNGNGHSVHLHPHHIKPFATNPNLRYELTNGITLCVECHRKEHKHTFIGKTKKSNPGGASSCTSGNK